MLRSAVAAEDQAAQQQAEQQAQQEEQRQWYKVRGSYTLHPVPCYQTALMMSVLD
jgi:hypothetical protein